MTKKAGGISIEIKTKVFYTKSDKNGSLVYSREPFNVLESIPIFSVETSILHGFRNVSGRNFFGIIQVCDCSCDF